ncbi:alpha-amylase [Chryseobacterium suipulveris]|uniref:Alpha-amylase n=1 Tax=Chryseobacterium suipulveris TaxID=2929800 RepID=A0ABY4BR36_9FLAO|nr:alpha-amylase [Chryseobacterium suipulveris]UOE41659.1 alpha-amylase [Chryseobacterium suipulveris]
MNATLLQSFHWYSEGNGSLYHHIKDSSDWLKELGISAVWFPPAYKGAGGGYSVGYDPYDLFDLGEFDQKGTIPTKYGTKEDYLEVIKTLKEKEIAVIADIVLNHKAGGDEKERFNAVKVDENNRQHNISDVFEIESFTKFTFPGRGNTYSDFEWNFTCFSGVDFAEGQDKGIFQIIHDHGDGWEEMISDEKGNYDYLMYNDIEHRNPHVREELNYWGKWYHDQIGFDGVRLDAVKHQSPEFYKEWLQLLRTNTGKNLFAVGEYWAPGQLNLLQEYIAATEGTMSLFDSSLQQNFHVASRSGADYDLRTIFDETLTLADPEHSVTVVDNHDTQPLQDLEAPVEKWFKPIAYALILLRESGYPCVFYPDLYGAHYWDKDKEGNDQEIFLDKVDGIEQLLKARKENAYGLQRDYFEDANCIGWTREGDGYNKGCAVVISNKDQYDKPMEMGTSYAGQNFYDLLGRFDHKITIDENGWGNFTCPAGNVSVWIPE